MKATAIAVALIGALCATPVLANKDEPPTPSEKDRKGNTPEHEGSDAKKAPTGSQGGSEHKDDIKKKK